MIPSFRGTAVTVVVLLMAALVGLSSSCAEDTCTLDLEKSGDNDFSATFRARVSCNNGNGPDEPQPGDRITFTAVSAPGCPCGGSPCSFCGAEVLGCDLPAGCNDPNTCDEATSCSVAANTNANGTAEAALTVSDPDQINRLAITVTAFSGIAGESTISDVFTNATPTPTPTVTPTPTITPTPTNTPTPTIVPLP